MGLPERDCALRKGQVSWQDTSVQGCSIPQAMIIKGASSPNSYLPVQPEWATNRSFPMRFWSVRIAARLPGQPTYLDAPPARSIVLHATIFCALHAARSLYTLRHRYVPLIFSQSEVCDCGVHVLSLTLPQHASDVWNLNCTHSFPHCRSPPDILSPIVYVPIHFA